MQNTKELGSPIYYLTSLTLTTFCAAQQREQELAEKKRREYEEWLRAQEMEAYRLEYDCSVKYEEHQAPEETSQESTQLTTNSSKIL